MRTDIQGLRGIAVLLVVLFHAGVGGFERGYLGVDIFFVISGFLVGGQVFRERSGGNFSFADFYGRRAKRLLPAAYTTLMFTILMMAPILSATDFLVLRDDVAATLGFVSNIRFWTSLNYFAGAAELRPLLHTWSLSIEEQFYLFLPVALGLLPARFARSAVVVGLLVSAIACFLLSQRMPLASFYLLPTRAWELLAGTALACGAVRMGPALSTRRLGQVGLGLVAAAVWLTIDPVHPRGAAFVAVAGTVFMLASPVIWLEQGRVARLLGWFGDISYSLYLLHWPLLVALRQLYGTDPPGWAVSAALALSLLLSWAQFRFIETPWRSMRLENRELAKRGILGAFACAGLVFLLAWLPFGPSSQARLALEGRASAVRGLTAGCLSVPIGVGMTACASGPEPTVALWGDSFAMHLEPGLAALLPAGRNFLQFTGDNCGATPDFAFIRGGEYHEAWARTCAARNSAMLRYLLQHPELETVIVGGSFHYGEGGSARAISGGLVTSVDEHSVVAAYRAMAEPLMRAGKRVVVVEPIPSPAFDVGRCVVRTLGGLPRLGQQECNFSLEALTDDSRRADEHWQRVSQLPGVTPLPLRGSLCPSGRCTALLGDQLVYGSGNHLSREGSVSLLRVAGLGSKL